jgi:hypothetical protein
LGLSPLRITKATDLFKTTLGREYPTLMCVMRWGSLGYVDENVPSKKASLEDIKKETVHTTMAACDG